ncbi:MAG: FAD-dependent oxidoreductase [Firmicutes bacterium]|nr:FAD-dependent oxidoreductase [Bacillota bacterium]
MGHQLVVIGGGYGGMYLLRTLLDNLPGDVEVTLVDRLPKSPLKTEFYSISAGTMALKDVTIPFPEHPQLRLVYDEVLSVDQARKQVVVREKDAIPYDTLVVGLGCVDRFHGLPGAEQYAYGLQSLKRAQATGHEILTLDAHRSVVLMGAGLTGIELAAELRESRPDLAITVVDRNERVLKGFSEKIQVYVEGWLKRHDVQILHGIQTKAIHPQVIEHEGGEIPFDRLVWTAGIKASPIVSALGTDHDSIGRVVVDEWQCLPTDPSIYVIGDCAASEHPPSAQLAEFQGEYVAQTLLARWHDAEPTDRQYQNKGALGSLGKAAGFGSVKGVELSGKIPRLLKSGVLWNYKKHVEQ